MHEELVTIASYATDAEAHLVRTLLEESGVQAFVFEGGLIGLTGVQSESKVLVAASDVRRALAALSAAEEAEPERLPRPPSQAVTDRPPRATGIIDRLADEGEEDGPGLNPREELAARALTGALVGVVFPPLQLYVTWLLCRVYAGDEPLGDGARWRAWVALLLNVPMLLVLALLALQLASD